MCHLPIVYFHPPQMPQKEANMKNRALESFTNAAANAVTSAIDPKHSWFERIGESSRRDNWDM